MKTADEKRRAYFARYRADNPDKFKGYTVKYRAKIPALVKARETAWRKRNMSRVRSRQAVWREQNKDKAAIYTRKYNSANPDKRVANCNARRARLLHAAPVWADATAVRAKYVEAQQQTKSTGVKHHVDHIVPLKHPLVCGLHVEHNLQVISAVANQKKNNRYWPDMPT